MAKLPFDPYAGAQWAYFVLYPDAFGEDWENWADVHVTDEPGQCDNYRAFADLCQKAYKNTDKHEQPLALHIAASHGYFAALAEVLEDLSSSQIASSFVEAHIKRHRMRRVNPLSQFE